MTDSYDAADNGTTDSQPGWLTTLNSLATTAGKGYSAYNAATSKTPTAPTLSKQSSGGAPAPAWQKYLPWGIGGLVVVIVLVVLVKK